MIAVSIEQIIDRFEDAWERGERPDIDAHLPDGEERLPLLIELVHIDLERRLKTGETARIESYVERYPELAEAAILTELVSAEFELRRRADPTLTAADYASRFPQLGPLPTSPTVSMPGLDG